MRSGSVPIYLKKSKAFIITSGGQNFDLKQFLEETKSALETLEKSKVSQENHNVINLEANKNLNI